jgi:Asp-tRNA(Asn)/Glu-tRNA(Gln) amidotransferase A subunit family amidase
MCGLAGLKPTAGVIGRRPIPDWIDLSTDGPLATSIDDLRLLLRLEAGPVAGDPTALPAWSGGPGRPSSAGPGRGPGPSRDPGLSPTAGLGRVLAAPRLVPWGPLPKPVAELFDAALAALQDDLGLRVEPLEPETIFRAGNPDLDWFTLAGSEHAHKLGRAAIESGADLLHPCARSFLLEGLAVPIEEYMAARRRRFEYVRELDELLGDSGVIATPTLASPGWLADGRMPGAAEPGVPDEVYNTAVQNITGHPALSLPAGRFPSGVPFGLQLTGPRFGDDLLLALGAAWEQARPWPPTAPGYDPFPG